jgi:5-methylcytosine-specific restriction endonuclease McrA
MGALKHIRRKKMIAQGGRCFYCGLPMWDDATATALQVSATVHPAPKMLRCTAEHLHARSDGGGNSPDNIVAACWHCNNLRHRRKRPLSPEAYRTHVQQRMAAGKWVAARFASGSLHA